MKSPSIIVKHNGRNIWGEYNEINLLETEDRTHAKLEMWIAKNIGDALIAHYPNRQWGVRVDIDGRMVILTCDSLSLERGYYLPMNGDTIDALRKRAVRACGEILERFNVSRDRIFNPDKLETLKRDFKDEVISTDAIPESLIKGLKSGH